MFGRKTRKRIERIELAITTNEDTNIRYLDRRIDQMTYAMDSNLTAIVSQIHSLGEKIDKCLGEKV